MSTEASPPKQSPWGKVQHSVRIADDLWVVGTASHGGVWVGPSKRSSVPEAFRARNFTGRSATWFEEDCDAVGVVLLFDACEPDLRESLERSASISLHPEVLEVLGVKPDKGNWHVRREREAQHGR